MFKPKKLTKNPENLEKAYEYAVYLLSLHLRTTGELVQKLHEKGYSEKTVEDIIEQLKQQKYLDDERYAEVFLENLKTYRNLGYYGIKKKLMLKRLPNELIDRILAENFSVEDEIVIAKRLLKKEGFEPKKDSGEEIRYSTYGDDSQNKAKQKLSSRLKSRGFRGEVIARLVF